MYHISVFVSLVPTNIDLQSYHEYVALWIPVELFITCMWVGQGLKQAFLDHKIGNIMFELKLKTMIFYLEAEVQERLGVLPPRQLSTLKKKMPGSRLTISWKKDGKPYNKRHKDYKKAKMWWSLYEIKQLVWYHHAPLNKILFFLTTFQQFSICFLATK